MIGGGFGMLVGHFQSLHEFAYILHISIWIHIGRLVSIYFDSLDKTINILNVGSLYGRKKMHLFQMIHFGMVKQCNHYRYLRFID